MMTREEFDERLLKFAREWHEDIWAAMPGSKADDLRSPAIRDALLAAYDAQAARIAELEAALRGLYEHTKNNQQICGLNERARAVLDKEA